MDTRPEQYEEHEPREGLGRRVRRFVDSEVTRFHDRRAE